MLQLLDSSVSSGSRGYAPDSTSHVCPHMRRNLAITTPTSTCVPKSALPVAARELSLIQIRTLIASGGSLSFQRLETLLRGPFLQHVTVTIDCHLARISNHLRHLWACL